MYCLSSPLHHISHFSLHIAPILPDSITLGVQSASVHVCKITLYLFSSLMPVFFLSGRIIIIVSIIIITIIIITPVLPLL